MASGAVTLLEASKSGDNTLKRGVVETLIQESPILEQLPMTPFAGNALAHSAEETLPSPAFRSVNEGYTRSFGTDTQHFWGVSILGGEVFVDNYLLKVTANKVSEKAKQYTKFAKAMSRKFDMTFFDGTGSAKDFKGINQLITDGFGLSMANATNGGALALHSLDEALDLQRGQASPSAILCNRFHRRKITWLARESVSGVSLIDVGDDKFGRKVTQYDGVGLRLIGDDINGNAILGFDEDPGDAVSDCSSLYIVTYGEMENLTGIMGLGGSFEVVDFGETESAPGHLGRVEVYPGIAIFNPYSVVRLYGITQA